MLRKIFFVIVSLFLLCGDVFAATLYLKTAGGNWTAAGTWSNTGSGGGDSSGPPLSTDTCIAETGSGNVTINATSACGSFSAIAGTGNWGGTLTHNANNLTVNGSVTFSAEMTYTNTASATLTLNGTGTLTTAGKLMTNISHAAGTVTIGDNVTFIASQLVGISRNTSAGLNINGNTIAGSSAGTRAFIRSGTFGTSRTITASTGSFSNCDFRDIALNVSRDLSAVTGGSGNCGGNSNITFTTPATSYWVGNAGNFTDAANHWASSSGGSANTGRTPLCQDTGRIDASSFNTESLVTLDMVRAGSIDFTGATNTPTFTTNGPSTIIDYYGSLALISAMTFTNTDATVFRGRGTNTLTSGGKTFGATVDFDMIAGTVQLQDAMTTITGSAGSWTLISGTFDANDFNVTIGGAWTVSGSTARTLLMGNGTWTLNRTGSSIGSFSNLTNLTMDAEGSTLLITAGSALQADFTGPGASTLIWNKFTIASQPNLLVMTTSGTGVWQFNGNFEVQAPRNIRFSSTETHTFNGEFICNGSSGNTIGIDASVAASAAILTKSSGIVDCDWMVLKDSNATGGAVWYAGANSTNTSGNSGWLFQDPPSSGGGAMGRGGFQAGPMTTGEFIRGVFN